MGSNRQMRIGIEELQRQRRLPFTGVNRGPLEHEFQRELKEAVARFLHARSFPVTTTNNFVARCEQRERSVTKKGKCNPPRVDPPNTTSTPADNHMRQFISLMEKNDMIFVSGGTGSGKSTRIPLALLAHSQYEPIKILSFQPKKVCCIALADYCCTMRGEDVGDAIGYAVQDSKLAGNNLTFRPYGAGALIGSGLGKFEDYSHIILDEIHEQMDGLDLVLLWLQETMTSAPNKKNRPKIILMSATFHDLRDRILSYFPGMSSTGIHVGGGTFEVDVLKLTDIVMLASSKITRTQTPAAQRIAHERTLLREEGENSPRLQQRFNSNTMVQLAAFRGRVQPESVMEALDMEYFRNPLSRLDDTEATELLIDAILYCCRSTFRRGAVLVFVPLVSDCEKLSEKFTDRVGHNGPKAHSLHRHIPIEDQEKIVNPIPDPGVRVIFATSIAESSLTIKNVAFVIDCGKGVSTTYSCIQQTYTYEQGWVSKASRDQRKGRTGRMQPGVYISFAPEYAYATAPALPTPAVLCRPLANTILALAPRNGDPFVPLDRVGQLFNKPTLMAVSDGVEDLVSLGALRRCPLEGTYALTPFGQIAMRIGCSVRESKRLIMSVLFKTVRPILNYSAAQAVNILDRRTNSPNQRAERVLKMQNNMSDFAALNRYMNTFDDFRGVLTDFDLELTKRYNIGLHDLNSHVSNRQALDCSLVRVLGDEGDVHLLNIDRLIERNKSWPITKCAIASAMHGFALNENPGVVVPVEEMRNYNAPFGAGYGINSNSLVSAFIERHWNRGNLDNNRRLWNSGEVAFFDHVSISRGVSTINGVTFVSKNIALLASGPLVEREDFAEQCRLLQALLDGTEDDFVITAEFETFRLKATKSTICTARIVRHLLAYYFSEFIRNGSLRYDGFEAFLGQVFGVVARLEDQTSFGQDFEYEGLIKVCDMHPPQRAARGEIRNLRPEAQDIPDVPRIPRPRFGNQRS